MDVICVVLGVCCWIFDKTALHITTICVGVLELILLALVKKDMLNESWLAVLISFLSIASGIVCLCV